MLNAAYIHIVINHWPIILTPVAFVLLLVGLGDGRDSVTRATLGLLIADALFSAGAYFTGRHAAFIASHVPDAGGLDHDTIRTFIHHHSTAAYDTTIVLVALGVFALWALVRYRRYTVMPRAVSVAVIIWSFVAVLCVGWTALLGGEIRHPEARPGFQAPVRPMAHPSPEPSQPAPPTPP